MKRLHPATLGDLPLHVGRPRYDREALRHGIVHLGAGAFQRAHLAAATEAALHAGVDLRWGIVGVSLRHADTCDALQPQQGLYTLALRDTDGAGAEREKLQIIGAMNRLLFAPADPLAVLDRIADPDTRIVSLTVTEKGYLDSDFADDIAHPDTPRSTLGFLVHGLHRRFLRTPRTPVTLLSCDNLPHNGDTLRSRLLACAEQVDRTLQRWIAAECSFPNSVVDRIVPRTTDADRERIARRLGLHDAWPVVAEPFFDWVIEDRFAAGRPAWDTAGARFVEHAERFERLKLRMLNGSHSALAYLGLLAGLPTIGEAIACAALRDYIERLMRDEIAPTLSGLPGLDLDAYRARLLERFANRALQHATRQIAMDGSQKLPQRLLDSVRDRLRDGASITLLTLAIAAWIEHLRGVDDTGARFDIHDPLAAELALELARAGSEAATVADPAGAEQRRIACFTRFAPVFGELGSDARFVQAVARHTLSLRTVGALNLVHTILNSR